jgi:3(or 17)beta-hydroxysteroid dehydrogenase
MARLKDKLILITGAAGSVGKAVAEAVSAAGGRAITSDLAGRQGAAHALDVTSEPDWLRVIGEIGRTHDRLDGLVNAAGLAALGNIEETDFDTWRQILAVNLDGTFLGCTHG